MPTLRPSSTPPPGPVRPVLAGLAAAFLAAVGASSAHAAISGQWDFDAGNLNATTGAAMFYNDGAGADTQAATAFGTTTSFGIPNIGGTEAKVMRFGTNTIPAGYGIAAPAAGNGGGSQVNQWTLLLDVLYPPAAMGKLRAIAETDGGATVDADIFIGANDGLGVGSFAGAVKVSTWHRLGIVADTAKNELRFYIDGAQVLVRNAGNTAAVDGRWALSVGGNLNLFADDNGQAAGGYVNSIQLHNAALSKGQVRALGGATAAGLPATIPPVPSGIEGWTPSGAFAARTTPIGALLSPGDATIQDSSISLALDGAAVASPTITRADGLIRVEKTNPGLSLGKHQLVLTYTDSAAGVRKLTNEFTAALFFEDFENVTLKPNKDEGLANDKAWTHEPPPGWSIDNSKFKATIIDPSTDPANGDEDGDGFPDNDGVTEWAGWSFAAKDWWAATAGDQRRTEFSLGTGNVAIADPDEWDDTNHIPSLMNTTMSTPAIPITGVGANTMTLAFASSWRPEGFDDPNATKFPVGPNGEAINNQTAVISASFDGGAPVQVLKWDSKDGSATFHTDLPNEAVVVAIPNPAGAKSMVLTFAMLESANDWWWAIDNVAVSAGTAPPTISTQPAKIEVAEGTSTNLTVVATGEGASYQWFKGQGTGRTAIAGATSATLAFAAAKVEDAGYYSVDVKNTAGTVKSGTGKLTVIAKTDGRVVLLNENFDGLALGANLEEGIITGTGSPKPETAVWSKAGPAGWTSDDTGVPGVGTDQDGVTEWAGWSFASPTWWSFSCGDQQRSLFTKAKGATAIADSDEWDDVAHAAGDMATVLKSKAISLAAAKAHSVVVQLDSSWRPESPQEAEILASFDGGTPVSVLKYHSDPNNAGYRPDEVNETLALRIHNPAGAKELVLSFAYTNTRNNWWWAFDNLVVLADKAPIFFEDFEGLVLGPNKEEGITTGTGSPKPETAVWTKTAPAGWVIDDTGVPGLGTAEDGVIEWAGWSFAKREWWAATAGDQRRTEFLKGTGTVAIADSDEWDDLPNPAAASDVTKDYRTLLTTRGIDITGSAANTLRLKFDSSWRDEEPQRINVTAAYDGAAPVEVLAWSSTPASPNFHDDSVNESVNVPLLNPAGAKSLKITFGYFDSYNNWWWAIDNLEVVAGDAVISAPKLEITRAANGLNLTWAGAGFTLEQRSAAAGGAWSPVAGAGANSATVQASAAAMFYRLRQ